MKDNKRKVIKWDSKYIMDDRIPFDVIGFLMFIECAPDEMVISRDYLLRRNLSPENLDFIEDSLIEAGVLKIVEEEKLQHPEHETVN